MKNNKINLSSRITHHSSSRYSPYGRMRDIVVGYVNAPLYPGLQISGMTNGAGGFTLIELLVVVLIIGILAAVALPQYKIAVEKSRATEAFVNLRAVHNEVELYYLANGEYPASLAEIDMETPDNHYFSYGYVRDIAVRLDSPSNAPTGRRYAIFRLLDHRTWNPQYPNAGCNVFLPDDGTSSFAAQLCKHLCKTSTLTTVWGGGEKGCRFNM